VRYVASDTHLALQEATSGGDEIEGDYADVRLRAGAFGSELLTVAYCDEPYGVHATAVALSATTLAYDATQCEAGGPLAVHELTTGERWELAHPDRTVLELDADGRYLAVASWPHRADRLARRVAVVDTGRREIRYELDLPAAPGFESLDVGPDGSLAVRTSRNRACEGEVTRYDASGNPTGRFVACGVVAQLAGVTVLEVAGGGGRELVAVDAAAGRRRPLVELGRVRLLGADADGGQVTWAVPTCSGGYELHLAALAAPPSRAGPVGCRGAIADRTVASRGGRALVKVRCPNGCYAALRLSAGRRTIAARRFWARPGRTAIWLDLGRRARARVAPGPLEATARLSVRDRDGRHHVVTRRVTLVAP
jgi:hypothetical protein